MTLNPQADQDLILARIKTVFGATEVHEQIDDVQKLPRYPENARLIPVAEVSFATLTPSPTGRTFAEEDAQPHESYLILVGYGGFKSDVRALMNRAMTGGQLIGWSPSLNCSGLWAGMGTAFAIRSADRPTIWVQQQVFRFVVNLAAQTV